MKTLDNIHDEIQIIDGDTNKNIAYKHFVDMLIREIEMSKLTDFKHTDKPKNPPKKLQPPADIGTALNQMNGGGQVGTPAKS